MDITLTPHLPASLDTDALVFVVFEGEKDTRFAGNYPELFESGEVTGKALQMMVLHRPAGFEARRLLLIGGGKPERFSAAELRKCAGAALRELKAKGARRIAMVLDDRFRAPEHVTAAVEGAVLGDFESNRYKTDQKDAKVVDQFTVAVPEGNPALEAALNFGRIVALAQNWARAAAGEPGNRLTPTDLADRARGVAAETGLEIEVLDRDRMQQLGMGALLGVAQGSAQPPALIILRYLPPEAPDGGPHIGLVGKGVTFDTGGISIKPADGMEKMRYDMSGGAAVIGAIRAIAELKPRMRVTALVPAVENMPGPNAQRPGDIVTTLSGKTVEVLNTDAEGRMILADTLTYAQRLGCTHLVDCATLTGAIMIALAHVYSGVFGNDEEFLGRLLAASRTAGEKMWRMPVDEDYMEYLKTPFADLPNIGGRHGGAVTAAMFLKEFAQPAPWVHIDIAGTAWLDDNKPHLSKGPAGVPVRTLVQLVMDWR